MMDKSYTITIAITFVGEVGVCKSQNLFHDKSFQVYDASITIRILWERFMLIKLFC